MAAATAQALCSVSLGTSVTSAATTRPRRFASTATNVHHIGFGAVCVGAAISSSKQSLGNERRGSSSIRCSAAADQPSSTTSVAEPEDSWVPVIPTSALPRGERRLIRQDADTVLLLWYKDELFALENSSPAEGAYSEGMFNAKLTPEGYIVCPSTESTFDLKTGEIKDWYPTNPILAFLTKPTRILTVYPVKTDAEYVYINTKRGQTGQTAEIVFGGQIQAGKTADDVSVDEVRMVVDEGESGFGFTPYTEIVNGRAAILGFTMLILTELVSGKGFLKGIGFLDFLYKYIK